MGAGWQKKTWPGLVADRARNVPFRVQEGFPRLKGRGKKELAPGAKKRLFVQPDLILVNVRIFRIPGHLAPVVDLGCKIIKAVLGDVKGLPKALI